MGFKVAGSTEAQMDYSQSASWDSRKTVWQPNEHCPSHVFLGTDTPSN